MTQETVAKTESPKETKVTQLAANRMQLAEHAYQVWAATPETGTPPDALLDARYWAHYAVNQSISIRPGHRIEAFAEDGTYFLELIVRDVYRGGIRVAELRRVKFDAVEHASDNFNGHEVKWQGNKIKWAVIRLSDKRRLSDGHEEKQGAIDWLREHNKAFAN